MLTLGKFLVSVPCQGLTLLHACKAAPFKTLEGQSGILAWAFRVRLSGQGSRGVVAALDACCPAACDSGNPGPHQAGLAACIMAARHPGASPWILQVRQYQVKKQMPLRAFRKQLAANSGAPVHKQRLWTFADRRNNTLRCLHSGASHDGHGLLA